MVISSEPVINSYRSKNIRSKKKEQKEGLRAADVGEEFTISFEAKDVAPGGGHRLSFSPPALGGGVPVFMCKHPKGEEWDCYLNRLVGGIAAQIPRLVAEVQLGSRYDRTSEKEITFKLGQRDGVFPHMRLGLYEKDDKRNAKLSRLGWLDLIDFNAESSQIKRRPVDGWWGRLTSPPQNHQFVVISK